MFILYEKPELLLLSKEIQKEAKLKPHWYGCFKSNSHRLPTLSFTKVIPRVRQLGKHSLKMFHRVKFRSFSCIILCRVTDLRKTH